MKLWLQGCVISACLLLTLPCCAARKRSNHISPEKQVIASTALNWEDYSEAMQQSNKDGKPICLFFTGSDWCMWCIKMQEKLLNTPQFSLFAYKHLHIVEIDFPQKKGHQNEEQKQKNRELKNQYGVSGFPELVFINGSGKELGRMHYEELDPATYVNKIRMTLNL
ncbi:disulfide reductase DsbH [Candidatus Chlamydia sanziniae]|uniref:Thioredoxin Disulfide Isomerase n=1 Tax=Candidatus Chlamydia sanziniae TaxID=1806891 RepID=A0A1A9HX92_9CHLA|nr:disulfide reductase DsbH [Candidatus Chlamydia sanziniae]ANH78723.1 Thioredoxin Disulfide Isomerase [Candidatus Chlamydia sanziniae]